MKRTRRALLQGALGAAMGLALPRGLVAATSSPTRVIPSSGEAIPAVGLGTWQTFNVGKDPLLRDESAAVMAAFFATGGGMIDSSPMYGSSQSVVGYGLEKLGRPAGLFAADKVWTRAADGRPQIEESRGNWSVPRFDLLQVHNLLGWEAHLETLLAMKAAGELRYVGITTSHGRRHELFEQVMRRQPLDFVQFTYNVADRAAEQRLLPLARERSLAVIVNRPFRRGALTDRLQGRALPDWAAEIGAVSWAQLLLKFILAEPAVTVVIPATTRVDHLQENKAAAVGPLPDRDLRQRIAAVVREL